MTPFPRCTPRTQAALGLVLCVVLAWPPLRHALEASMWRHMVLQFPLLLLAGAAWAGALPPAWQGRSINQYGITGWVAASSILAVLMIPRVLDLALLRPEVEVAKCTALVLAGLALRLSWQPAGRVLQFFFLERVHGLE